MSVNFYICDDVSNIIYEYDPEAAIILSRDEKVKVIKHITKCIVTYNDIECNSILSALKYNNVDILINFPELYKHLSNRKIGQWVLLLSTSSKIEALEELLKLEYCKVVDNQIKLSDKDIGLEVFPNLEEGKFPNDVIIQQIIKRKRYSDSLDRNINEMIVRIIAASHPDIFSKLLTLNIDVEKISDMDGISILFKSSNRDIFTHFWNKYSEKLIDYSSYIFEKCFINSIECYPGLTYILEDRLLSNEFFELNSLYNNCIGQYLFEKIGLAMLIPDINSNISYEHFSASINKFKNIIDNPETLPQSILAYFLEDDPQSTIETCLNELLNNTFLNSVNVNFKDQSKQELLANFLKDHWDIFADNDLHILFEAYIKNRNITFLNIFPIERYNVPIVHNFYTKMVISNNRLKTSVKMYLLEC